MTNRPNLSAKVAGIRAWAEEMRNATGGDVAASSSTSGARPTPNRKKETVMDHVTPPPLSSDDVTYYRHIITGGPGNERQKLTVEVMSFVDNGVVDPPVLSVLGELDMNLDQLSELNEALFRAQYAQMHARRAQLEAQR